MSNNIVYYILVMSVFLGVLGIYLSFLGVWMLYDKGLILYEWEFKNILYSSMEFIFWFDWMSFVFMGLVMFISSMVMLYSVWYMGGDLGISRFINILLMFVFSMIMFIVSPNLVSVLLGWDGLGLVSYCLIIYYNNWSSYVSGMITVMFNRLGDIGILLSIGYLLSFGDWNIVYFGGGKIVGVNLLGVLLVLAGMTKSAQIPFCSWLPIAMAAPTPVSSLVHSSTLVTAGVYLLVRYSEFLDENELLVLGLLGGLTMIVSGLVANYEYDLSSIVALSTLSQLGFMFLLVSLGMIEMVFFHLIMHALFSVVLFMFSGILIHLMGGLQDVRLMGGIFSSVPEILLLILISGFSLMGIPFFMGFYSKDLSIEFSMIGDLNIFVWLMLMTSVGLTIGYMIRVYVFIIFNVNSYECFCGDFSGELSNFMIVSSWVLIGFVLVMGGYLLSVMFPYLSFIILEGTIKFNIMFFVFLGILVGICKFLMLSKSFIGMVYFKMVIYFIYLFFGGLIYMPSLSLWGSLLFMDMGYLSIKCVDKGWLEFKGGQGLFSILIMFSSKIQWFQDWKLFEYFILFIVMLIFFLFMFF